MTLSKTKAESIARKRRRYLVNQRSLDGKGYFMDSANERDASAYVETGDPKLLNNLPDYRKNRGEKA